MVSTINEDSHWLLNMVENLLSVTRIQNDGRKGGQGAGGYGGGGRI